MALIFKSDAQSFTDYWALSGNQNSGVINHLQPESTCRNYYDTRLTNWPSSGILKINTLTYDQNNASFWLLVEFPASNSPIILEPQPSTLFPGIPLDNSISAFAYGVSLENCPCDNLDELESLTVLMASEGGLIISNNPSYSTVLIRVNVSSISAGITLRGKQTSTGLKTDCTGRRTEGNDDGLTIIEWIDDDEVLINTPNPPCESSLALCNSGVLSASWSDASAGQTVSTWLTINHLGGPAPIIELSGQVFQNYLPISSSAGALDFSNVSIYPPASNCTANCNQLQIGNSTVPTSSSFTIPAEWFAAPGTYLVYIELSLTSASQSLNVEFQNVNCEFTYPDPEVCVACLPQFVPQAGKKYVIGAWVKEIGAPLNTINYTKPYLQIAFIGSTAPEIQLRPEGQIIDGWQRIEGTISFPSDATSIEIKPGVDTGEAYFDDLRFFPYDGSMKSYVYDPDNLRFIAELDERNFATFYEYDEEGKLTRIKKETERGVMTIQESKSSNVKKQNYPND
jgi:hypothetical protein